MKSMSLGARAFIYSIQVAGFCAAAFALSGWEWVDSARFAGFLVLALLASGMKVSLPGVNGSMSVVFLFVLVGIVTLPVSQVVLLAIGGTLLQCFYHVKNRPRLHQVLFNLSSMTLAVCVSDWMYHEAFLRFAKETQPLLLGLTASVFFVVNTIPVAVAIGLTEKKSIRKVWAECYFWSFPYYLIGAAVAGLISAVASRFGWQTSLCLLPVIYFIYRSYRLYLGRLEQQKKHAEEVAALHLRTIEALALAIEAKDQNTHTHLQRVQIYAVELGKTLGLRGVELDALRAAAVLHDIGKLAVPEHIISKPGRLTPEEFEKMKIHPIVGAEILERVQFPYPVVPIVCAHHEKWDGSGYPHGLKGEEIPIGARILAAVDCLDALSSDRQYRRALPLEKALDVVTAQANQSFDPRVVVALRGRIGELEKIVQEKAKVHKRLERLSTNLKIENGHAPAAGFEVTSTTAPVQVEEQTDFLNKIAAARQEVQGLYELSQNLGNSLCLDDTLSVVSSRLKRLVPNDAVAIYMIAEGYLVPEYVTGEDFHLFSSLRIPMGEGVSGWVAENRKPVVNGNPSVEPGYLNDPAKFSKLRSALAVPLETPKGLLGVLTLYAAEGDAFTKDHLRVMLAVSSKIALSIENALRFRIAESSATTDYLTGLPNARSLFLHLDAELSRCRRSNTPVTLLVCDLDGFKQVNDCFGHLRGNEVLRVLASKLKGICREYDYVARMGGDEFVIVLPGMRQESLLDMLRRLHWLAVEAGIEVCGEQNLSMSIGHASFPSQGKDTETLLAEADRQMYLEKQKHHVALDTDRLVLNLPPAAARVC